MEDENIIKGKVIEYQKKSLTNNTSKLLVKPLPEYKYYYKKIKLYKSDFYPIVGEELKFITTEYEKKYDDLESLVGSYVTIVFKINKKYFLDNNSKKKITSVNLKLIEINDTFDNY